MTERENPLRKQALRDVVRFGIREVLELPETFISDRTLDFVCDTFVPTPAQTGVALSITEHLMQETTYKRAKQMEEFHREWTERDRAATLAKDPQVFISQVLKLLPVPDANNYANDVAAQAAMKRVANRDVPRRLAAAAAAFDAELERDCFQESDDSSALQELLATLDKACECAAAVTGDGLMNKPSAAYAAMLHNYADALDSVIVALEAVPSQAGAREIASERQQTTIDSQAPLKSDCHFSRHFGIVHSAVRTSRDDDSGSGRGKSPAPARATRNASPGRTGKMPPRVPRNESPGRVPRRSILDELSISDDEDDDDEPAAAPMPVESAIVAVPDPDAPNRVLWGINTKGRTRRAALKSVVCAPVRLCSSFCSALLALAAALTFIMEMTYIATASVGSTPAQALGGFVQSYYAYHNIMPYSQDIDVPYSQSLTVGYVIYRADTVDASVQGGWEFGKWVYASTPSFVTSKLPSAFTEAMEDESALVPTGVTYVPPMYARWPEEFMSRCFQLFGRSAAVATSLGANNYKGRFLFDVLSVLFYVGIGALVVYTDKQVAMWTYRYTKATVLARLAAFTELLEESAITAVVLAEPIVLAIKAPRRQRDEPAVQSKPKPASRASRSTD